jgi:autotransporter-associated beta strand protein
MAVSGTGIMNVGTTATTSGEIRIGNTTASNGTFNVSGGTVTVGTGSTANQIYFFKAGSGAGFTAAMTQSNGTVTTNGIQFGGATGTYDAGSAANLTLTGGNLYIGAQGITKGSSASALPTTIKLEGGTLGANQAWSSSLNMQLGTTGGGVTIRAQDAASAARDITLSGILSNVSAVAGTLTKTGTGTLTLSGSNSYTGATAVTAGTLTLSGTGAVNSSSGVSVNGSGAKLLQTSSVAVSSAVALTQGTLTGSGTVNTVNAANSVNAIISNNNGVAGAALTIGNLTLAGAANINLFSNSTAANLVVTSALTTAATPASITANSAGGWANGSTYTLLTYGSLAGSGNNFTHVVNNLVTRQVATWGDTGSAITLAVAGDTPVWSGANGGTWQTAVTDSATSGTPSWALKSGLTASDFWAADGVEFNDTVDLGAGPVAPTTTTVNIAGASVSPTTTTFNNSAVNYTLNSSGGFGIAAGSLTKNGSGTLTINTANAYTGATTVSAGTLALAGSLTGGTAITVSGTGVLSQSAAGVISGAASVTHSSSGTSTLAGNNTYTGATAVSGGTLKLTGTGKLGTGSTYAGAISIASTAVFENAGSTGQNLTGAITGAGTLVNSGAGSLILTNASNSFAALNISSGRTFINTNAAALPSAATVALSGGILVLNAAATYNQAITMSSGAGIAARAATILTGVTLPGSGSITLNNDDTTTSTLSISNTKALTGALTVEVGGNRVTTNPIGAVTLSGILSGAGGSLVKTGAGQMTLQGANTFDGGVSIKNGTLESRTTTTTLGSGTVTMGGSGSTGATYLTGQDNSNAFLINAPDSGSVVIGTNAGTNGFTMSGAITLNGNVTLQTFNNAITAVTKAASGFSGGITGTGNVLLNNLGLDDNTITLTTGAVNHTGSLTLQGTATGDTTIGANIGANVTGVTQNSATSRLILSGTNTYTGATTVNAGTLAVNGSLANTSTTVGTGGTLQGSGSMGGSVTVQSGGKIAAGNSIESLATGALSLLAGSTFAYEMNNDAAASVAGDLTAITGSMTFDVGNAALLTLTELGTGSWSNGDKLTLLSYSGAWNGGLFNYASSTLADDSTFTFSGMEWAFNYNDAVAGTNYTGDLTGSSFVTMTAVPEPNVAALVGGLGALVLLRRRRN